MGRNFQAPLVPDPLASCLSLYHLFFYDAADPKKLLCSSFGFLGPEME